MVEKHRHGATRSIDLMFEGQYTRFSNPADDQMAPR
jgi:replicative DNA helicase